MIPQPKFKLNEAVVLIDKSREYLNRPCEACYAKGRIRLGNGKHVQCPDCYGAKVIATAGKLQWRVTKEVRTVGKITASVINIVPDGCFSNVGHYEEGYDVSNVEYMMYETGVGSGTCFKETDLFKTEIAAQAECDLRNAKETE